MFSRADELSRLLWMIVVAVIALVVRQQNTFLLFFAFPLLVILVDFSLFWRVIRQHWKIVLLLPMCLLFFHYVSILLVNSIDSFQLATNDPTGFMAAARVFFVVLISLAFFEITDARRLADGISRLGLSYKWAFVVYLGLSYVDVLRNVAQDIKDSISLRIRGRKLSIVTRLSLFVRFVFLLVVTALMKADKTALAMQSRAFGQIQKRTFIRTHTWNGPGLFLCVAQCAWAAFALTH